MLLPIIVELPNCVAALLPTDYRRIAELRCCALTDYLAALLPIIFKLPNCVTIGVTVGYIILCLYWLSHPMRPRFLITEMRKYHLVCTGIEQCLLLPAFQVCVRLLCFNLGYHVQFDLCAR